MNKLPFFIVTLTQTDFDAALACAASLPREALPELRLDLFPDEDPADMVQRLGERCLVSCRRIAEFGRWDADEPERLARLEQASRAYPAWLDLEWDLEIPSWLRETRTHTRLLRSVHVAPGVFDLDQRLASLPEGDAFKWVGHARQLADNAILKTSLATARDRDIALSAFLMGSKGIASRCMQAAWGGAFTYAAPDDAPMAAPGQLPISTLLAWRVHKLRRDHGLCGVLGSPVDHSLGPAFHNPRFQNACKDLLYLPLECDDAAEALEALERLPILGASLTMPLKTELPVRMHLPGGPWNTLFRRHPGEAWQCTNTDQPALREAITGLERGPVLLLGDGGVASISRAVLESQGHLVMQASRRTPLAPAIVLRSAPIGVVQATSLGMKPDDPLPFPDLLEAAIPSLRWAVEWIYREDTAFARMARDSGVHLVDGNALFHRQAEAQSRIFIAACGG